MILSGERCSVPLCCFFGGGNIAVDYNGGFFSGYVILSVVKDLKRAIT